MWGGAGDVTPRSVFHHAVCTATSEDKLWQMERVRDRFEQLGDSRGLVKPNPEGPKGVR